MAALSFGVAHSSFAGPELRGPQTINIAPNKLVLVSGSVQSAGTLAAEVKGPRGENICQLKLTSSNGRLKEFPSCSFNSECGGDFTINFNLPNILRSESNIFSTVSSRRSAFNYLQTYLFAVNGDSDKDFNDIVLSVQVFGREG